MDGKPWSPGTLVWVFSSSPSHDFDHTLLSQASREPAWLVQRCSEPHTWVGKIPWRRKWQPTPVFLPGKSHGRQSLVGYCPWGRKESDRTDDFTFTFTFNMHLKCSLNLSNNSVRLFLFLAPFTYGKTEALERLNVLLKVQELCSDRSGIYKCISSI